MTSTHVRVGTRVRLRRTVDRRPHFLAGAGMIGTITDIGIHAGAIESIWAKMDQHLAGAEEWDNEILWTEDDLDRFAEDVERFDVTARIEKVIAESDAHLGDCLTIEFPEAKFGDVSPEVTHQWRSGLEAIVKEWVSNNVAGANGRRCGDPQEYDHGAPSPARAIRRQSTK